MTLGGHTHTHTNIHKRLTEQKKKEREKSLSSLWSEKEEKPVPSTAHLAPSQRWISRFSLQFDFIAAPPFSAVHLWVSFISPECAWMRCSFSSLSKIHRVAICVWQSLHHTYLYFTFSPSNTFISSLSCILFIAIVLISSRSASPSRFLVLPFLFFSSP